ncbi:hypothetical protein AGMMS49982_20170 [Bacteroidia bacterium]|nr:hypothetical protein AGMMS49982_20170 [Bacteroidia bacterium]
MKRIAAHHIIMPSGKTLDMHYAELDDNNNLVGVFPLQGEMERTVFHSGTINLGKRVHF